MQIKWSKCQFLQKKINFLGHIIEDGKVRPSEEKTKPVKNFPVPRSEKDIQSFLVLAGYSRKFIPYYAKTAKPLSGILRKEHIFKFEEERVIAFNLLKEALTSQPILKILN